MVMHSNERGECDLRTLVDRQRKRYDNVVDVVVRLHGPTDQAPKLRHLRVLAHVQLDDDPQTPIQQSVGEEFRQHNGVVTILMYYRRRASPKHSYNIIEEFRRSPAPVASSSPSSRRRADEALPRHSAGSRVRGTSPS